jgi:chemotaxis protein histidine kinase CheA
MIDNDGSENPVTLPIGESKVQKQESVTDGSSKATPRRGWSYPWVGGLIVVTVAVYCSIFPPPVAWVGMGTSQYESQVATENTDRKVDGTITKKTTTQKTDPSKTLWDWMSLLLAPAALASLGFWFQSSQEQAKAAKEEAAKKAEEASKERAEEQTRQEKERAEEQTRQEKERAEDRQREDALENYINSISDLLIGKGLSTLVKQKEKSLLKQRQEDLLNAGLDVIRARTLSILRRLTDEKDSKPTDAERKGSILLFLYDTGLIKSQSLLSLSGANLRDAKLNGAKLNGANLMGAKLNGADLNGADLNGANLMGAKLHGADLSDADLSDANLLATDLRTTQNFNPTQLKGEDPLLCNVALPEGFKDKDKLKDRDCDRLPQEFLKRYTQRFQSLEDAKKYVDVERQKKWE